MHLIKADNIFKSTHINFKQLLSFFTSLLVNNNNINNKSGSNMHDVVFPLLYLPEHIILKILSLLNAQSVYCMAQANFYLMNLCEKNYLWRCVICFIASLFSIDLFDFLIIEKSRARNGRSLKEIWYLLWIGKDIIC